MDIMKPLYLAWPSWLPDLSAMSEASDRSTGMLFDILLITATAALAWTLAMNARRLKAFHETLHAVLVNSQQVAASTNDAELNSRRTLTILHNSLSDVKSIADALVQGQRRLDDVVKTQSSSLDAHRKTMDTTVEAFFEKLTGHTQSLAAAPQSFAASVHTLSGVAMTIENLVELQSKSVEALAGRIEELRPKITDTAATLESSLDDSIEKQLLRYKQALASMNDDAATSLEEKVSALREDIAKDMSVRLLEAEHDLKELCRSIATDVQSLTDLWRGVDGKLGDASQDMMQRWSSRLLAMQNNLDSAVVDVSNALADRVDALTLAVGMNADVVRRDILNRIEDLKETARVYDGLAKSMVDSREAYINHSLNEIAEKVDATCGRLDLVSQEMKQELDGFVLRAEQLARTPVAALPPHDDTARAASWNPRDDTPSLPAERDWSVEHALTHATRALRSARF